MFIVICVNQNHKILEYSCSFEKEMCTFATLNANCIAHTIHIEQDNNDKKDKT